MPDETPSKDFCASVLARTQHPDGGWGFQPELHSAVEPTAWAMLALAAASPGEFAHGLSRGTSWLRAAQLEDGSWPPFPGQSSGSWTTAPAALALRIADGATPEVARGVDWLCRTWPREHNWWWRLRRWLATDADLVRQNHSLVGWGWSRETSSWVEPTAYALFLLQNLPENHSQLAAKRIRLAERMLYDRMCPGGGWNCGNPLVYGTAGEPQVMTTVWALLALRKYRDRRENRQSVAWLERAAEEVHTPDSSALATLGLRVYGGDAKPAEAKLQQVLSGQHGPPATLTAAWVTLAFGPVPPWLG